MKQPINSLAMNGRQGYTRQTLCSDHLVTADDLDDLEESVGTAHGRNGDS